MKPGIIFNIQRFSVQDGAGIRTTIFTKGCPLRCPWCSNPESQQTGPQVGHVDALCNHCGICVPACEWKAISLVEPKGVRINRDLCNNCGKCVEVCPESALKSFGIGTLSLEEIIEELERDSLFYRNSGGGITCSGGEPLSQPKFVSAIFRRCHELGLHTALETTGYATPAALDMVAEYTDTMLYDLKIMDPDAHMRIIKVSNKPILRNFRELAGRGVPKLVVRIPLIPGITDTDENLTAIVRFVRDVDSKIPVNILPYHRYGMSKYSMLDREYSLPDLQPQSEERLASIRELCESHGLSCEVIR